MILQKTQEKTKLKEYSFKYDQNGKSILNTLGFNSMFSYYYDINTNLYNIVFYDIYSIGGQAAN